MEKRINKPSDGDDKVRKNRKPVRKKVCQFCVDKNKDIDYKEITKIKRFITEKGKIIPRRTSGTCAEHQRQLTLAIKKARIMALLPFKAE